jgi:hypothetical protein
METNNWFKGGIAAALAATALVGSLSFANAQTSGPTATPSTRPNAAQNGAGMMQRGGQKGGAQFAVVAKALGIDEATLKTELQGGKTIADVAKAKSIDINTVINAIVENEKAQLAQAVTDGKLTQAQADARLADAQTRATDFVNGTMPQKGGAQGGQRGGPKGGAHGGGAMLTAAAQALGMDEASLTTELQAGKTIADVAKAKGVDINTVINAIVAQETKEATTRATDFVNGTMPAPHQNGQQQQRSAPNQQSAPNKTSAAPQI